MDVLEPKYYAAIGMVMTLIAVIFLFLMGSALVHSTKSFWQGYSTELSWETDLDIDYTCLVLLFISRQQLVDKNLTPC